MRGLVHAVSTGIIAGVFNPFCCLSSFFFGGIAIGIFEQYNQGPPLSLKEVWQIGILSGLNSGLSGIVFWYAFLRRTEDFFPRFFNSKVGISLSEHVHLPLLYYGMMHLLLSLIFAQLGALFTMWAQRDPLD